MGLIRIPERILPAALRGIGRQGYGVWADDARGVWELRFGAEDLIAVVRYGTTPDDVVGGFRRAIREHQRQRV